MKTYREYLVNEIERARKDFPNAIEIHTPFGCKNGHLATQIVFYAYGRQIVNYLLPVGDDECQCPKDEIGEGYRPLGKSFVVK
jgi:hypothetical protein